jgi:dienelactone hydrolase
MDQRDESRRRFLQSATLATAAGSAGVLGGAALPGTVLAQAAAPAGSAARASAAPAAEALAAPHTRRFAEQRWAIDNTIRAVGMDWDQPRSIYLSSPCGPEASADFAAIRERIKKLADATPAFEATARRREAKARAAEEAGDLVTARENYFMASVHWGAAQWPIDAPDAQNLALNKRKRECYANYARLADHTVEEVWIPLPDGRRLPAWLHLPPSYRGGQIPAVIAVPGMDSFKEMNIAMYGDRWLSRGMAVLSIDGPGQYEAPLVGVFFSMQAWEATGTACVEWLSRRPEIDATRIATTGNSFGSFFCTIAAAREPRIRAISVTSTCHEPGFHTIFEEASPTFKMRFMFMSGITDEARFDAFRKTMTWEGYAEKISAPYLCLAGEFDELSPLIHTERLMHALAGPKRLVIYQDSRHSVGGVPAANLGPAPGGLSADWTAAVFAGRSFPSERWFVEASGRIVKTPL